MGSQCCKADKHAGAASSQASIGTRGDEEVPSGGRFRVSENNNTVLLSVEGVSAADAGRYSLLAKNAAGEARAALELRVGRDAPCFLRRLSDLAVKVGTRTRFLVELKAPHDVKVTWLHEDRPLPQDDRFQLVREGGFFCVDVAPVTVHDSGRWTCLAENAIGRSCCSCTLNVLVPKAYKPPEFVEPLRALLSAAGTVSLECKVVGVPTPALRWLKDGKEIRAGDVLALTADPASLGTYTCEASNCMGRATSSSRVIVEGAAADSFRAAGPPPVFIKELQPAKCRIGDPLTLSCQVAVPPWPRAVSWYNSAGRVEPGERYLVREDGLGGFSVHVVAVEAADDGDWKCVATSDLGAAAFSRAAVAVHYPKNYRKPRFLESLKAVLTEEGLVSFECKVVGFPTPQLRWFKDGQELRPGDVYQLTGTNSLGSYSCIARNCMGEATSTAELTVEDIQSQLSDEERLALLSHNQAPRFIRGLKSCEARIDEPFRFTVQVTVSPEPVVTWYRDDDLVADSDRYEIITETLGTVNLDVKRLEIVDQAEWKCVASNDFGHSVTSCFLKLVIPKHYKKPRFLECLRAILSEEGAVNLECKVIGVPQPVLKWYKDGAELKPGDIHRIISGQDGTCCLGTYTCEAHNCMGTVASSASLLGFEERVMKAEAPAMAVAAGAAAGAAHPLARNTSLSTIQEERTSQLCDVLSERPDLSFSFDGREVSVSLYETPDLTEEQALAVVEMYAEQLSEHVSEHNVVDLPPMRFTKESSQSGNLLMEAVVIDVSGEYFTTADEDLRTDADLEELSITDDNGQQPQLPRDDDTAAEASPPVRPPRANKQQSSADNTFHSLSDDTRYDSPASGGVSPPAAAAGKPAVDVAEAEAAPATPTEERATQAGVVRPKRRSVESGQGESFENLSSASEASVARPGQILRKGTLRKRSRSTDTAASAEDVSGGETPLPRRRQLSLDMEAPKDDSYSEEGDGLKTRLLRDAAGRRSAKTPSVESVREEEPLIPTTIVTEVESRQQQQQQQQQQQRALDIDLPTLHAPPPPPTPVTPAEGAPPPAAVSDPVVMEQLTRSLQEIQRGLAAVEEQVRSESASEPQLARTSLSVLETLSQPVEQLRRGLEQPEQLVVEQLAQPVQELRRGLQLVEQQRAVMAEEDDHSLLERTSASILETVAQPVRQLSQLLQQQSAEPAQGGAVSDRRLSQVSEQLQLQQQQQQEAEPSAVLHGIARPVLELQRGLTFLQQQAVLEASGDTRLFENAGRSILSTLERPFQDLQRGIAALEEQVGGEGPSSGVLGASILEAVLSPLRELQSGIAEVQRQAATEAEEDGFEPDVKRYAVLKTLSGPVAELQRAVVEIGERFSVEAAVAGGGAGVAAALLEALERSVDQLTRRAVSVSKLAVLRGKTVSETEGLAVLGNLAPPLVKLQKEVIRAQNELRARPPEGGGGSEGGAEGAAEQAAAWGAVAVRALAKPLADFRRGLLAVERQLAAESEEEPIREGQIAAALRALADPVADLMRGIDGLQKAEVGQPNQELIQPFQELQRGLTQVQQVVFETSPELIPASGVVKKLTLSLQEVTKKLTDVDAAVVGSLTPETEPASKLTGLAQPMKQLKKGLVQIAQATSFSAEDIPAIATLVQPLVQLQKGLEKMERQLTAAAQSVDPTPEKKLTAIIEPIKEMQKGIRAIKRQAILEPQSTNMECLESLVQPFENLKRQLEEIERKRPESPGIRLLDEVMLETRASWRS
ncbi:muscle M-line assembly protein unc-89-like [Schistocerca americana]|uniref:muscle M-line assembly protein unc-89-like n=1 Tax=Schistocerca americana TaxID=7009 RepID=UPI001F4FB7DD|nr:muscle M-line assembly protein unc-89-like [Schistocerca americana]